MKQLIFFLCTAALVNTAISQTKTETNPTTASHTKIAIKGGANMSTARVYQNDQKLDSKFISGYGIGILFKVPFEGLLHFSPSVVYNKRGYTYRPKSGNITEYQNTIHYIDIFTALSIDLPAGKNTFVLSAGPHFSAAIAGTEKTSTGTTSSSSKMKFSISNNYGVVDMGVGGSLGFHMKKFLVEASYQLGLANINNNIETDFRNIRNRMVSLQVGYFLK
jgi:Outer membrane protein beta-barrel domain